MNHLNCEYQRADRLGSFERLKRATEFCSHVKLSHPAGAGFIEMLVCVDSPCLRQDNVFEKDCGKPGKNQFWLIAKLEPTSNRRPVDGIIIDCKVISRKPDLLKFKSSIESEVMQEITPPPLYLAPIYSKRESKQKLVESEHIDDQPILYICDPGENILFAKVGVKAIIWPNSDRAGIPKLQDVDFELTIQPRSSTMTKTVVEVDLVHYGELSRILEESISTDAVAQLNDKIQSFIDQSLSQVELSRGQTVVKTTGDGAILIFDQASQAHVFAETLHSAMKTYNATKTENLARLFFRIGIATGDIAFRRAPDGSSDIAGTTIARAVRLEVASNPGEVLVDTFTYDALPVDLKLCYANEEGIQGKRDEIFQARRLVINPPETDEWMSTRTLKPKIVSFDRHKLLELLERLNSLAMLDKLIFLLEMPIKYQPSRNLNYDESCIKVLQWAESPAGCGFQRIQSELQYLIDRQ